MGARLHEKKGAVSTFSFIGDKTLVTIIFDVEGTAFSLPRSCITAPTAEDEHLSLAHCVRNEESLSGFHYVAGGEKGSSGVFSTILYTTFGDIDLPTEVDKLVSALHKDAINSEEYAQLTAPPILASERSRRGIPERSFLSYEDARKIVHAAKIPNMKKWDLRKLKERPSNVPASPYETYRDKGWISYTDWLGNGNISFRVIHAGFLSFEDARSEVQETFLHKKKEPDGMEQVEKEQRTHGPHPEQPGENIPRQRMG